MTAKSSLPILFEDPFWVGLHERIDGDKYEVYDLLLKNWHKLKFSPPAKTDRIKEHKINPKRMQREIDSQSENRGIGTKA